jgi:large subunit ribosomal protein L29
MEYRELQALNDDQLDGKLGELQEESFNLRFQFATRQLTNTARLREVRKDIARVKTEQRARELAAAEG